MKTQTKKVDVKKLAANDLPDKEEVKEVKTETKKPASEPKVTKKSVVLEFLNKKGGGSIAEMAQAIVDRGIDPDLAKNKRVCSLWIPKCGVKAKKLETGNYVKA